MVFNGIINTIYEIIILYGIDLRFNLGMVGILILIAKVGD